MDNSKNTTQFPKGTKVLLDGRLGCIVVGSENGKPIIAQAGENGPIQGGPIPWPVNPARLTTR